MTTTTTATTTTATTTTTTTATTTATTTTTTTTTYRTHSVHLLMFLYTPIPHLSQSQSTLYNYQSTHIPLLFHPVSVRLWLS